MLRRLEKNGLRGMNLKQSQNFAVKNWAGTFLKDYLETFPAGKTAGALWHLDRPMRICGIVRNEGELGGAPFWVREEDGSKTLQIVESAHVNQRHPSQKNIWSKASYFNPVDMVCCTKNYRGKKFNLMDYVNRNAYLIIAKTEKGRRLKAQELPGLWNGGMAYWNTVFVELPLIVFNPVKTVYDLLRPQHRGVTRFK